MKRPNAIQEGSDRLKRLLLRPRPWTAFVATLTVRTYGCNYFADDNRCDLFVELEDGTRHTFTGHLAKVLFDSIREHEREQSPVDTDITESA